MAIHAVEHTIYNLIAHKKGNWTVTELRRIRECAGQGLPQS